MKITGIIEKGKEMYAVRSDDMIGRCCLGGFGDSVDEAREDFLVSIEEAIEDATKEGFNPPEMKDISVLFTYDLPSFFNYFDYINISKFASYVGINESKMRQYKSGLAFPCEKTTKKILSAIKQIGNELLTVAL
ncbi:MAG: pilus assembly protein HicB [Bacteroidales bacterium]|nr:pilus assembly protein HicB [Bacteroidales bacterium]